MVQSIFEHYTESFDVMCRCSSEPASVYHPKKSNTNTIMCLCVFNQFLPFMVINCDDIASALCVFVCVVDCVCRIFYVKCMRCKYVYHSEMNISYQMQFTISINGFFMCMISQIVVNSLLMCQLEENILFYFPYSSLI